MSRIFDCCIIRDELDILKIRMAELWEHVDVFVIVEADKTFSQVSKPFVAEDLIFKYNLNLGKQEIRYIQVTDMPEVINEDRWPLEFHQRNAMMRGLYDLQGDDIVMMSDVDEIWDPKVFNRDMGSPTVFQQLPMVGYLNIVQLNSKWYGTIAVRGTTLREHPPQILRNMKNGMPWIKGGWHFSWCGGREIMEIKAHTFCHTAQECLDAGYPAQILRRIASMDGVAKVEMDTLPKYIQENLDYLKNKGFILE